MAEETEKKPGKGSPTTALVDSEASAPRIEGAVGVGGNKLGLTLSPLVATWLGYELVWNAHPIHKWWVQAVIFLDNPTAHTSPKLPIDISGNLFIAICALGVALLTRRALDAVNRVEETMQSFVRRWMGIFDRWKLGLDSRAKSLNDETGRLLEFQRTLESDLKAIKKKNASLDSRLTVESNKQKELGRGLKELTASMHREKAEVDRLTVAYDGAQATWLILFNALDAELQEFSAVFGDYAQRGLHAKIREAQNEYEDDRRAGRKGELLRDKVGTLEQRMQTTKTVFADVSQGIRTVSNFRAEHAARATLLDEARRIPNQLMSLRSPAATKLLAAVPDVSAEQIEKILNGIPPEASPTPDSPTGAPTDSEGPGGGVSS